MGAGLSEPPPSSSGSKSPFATADGSRPSNSIMAIETKMEQYGTQRKVRGRVKLLSVMLNTPKNIRKSSGHFAPFTTFSRNNFPARQMLTANPQRKISNP